MRVKRLPTILALHLKRFKYVEQYNRHIKVNILYRYISDERCRVPQFSHHTNVIKKASTMFGELIGPDSDT